MAKRGRHLANAILKGYPIYLFVHMKNVLRDTNPLKHLLNGLMALRLHTWAVFDQVDNARRPGNVLNRQILQICAMTPVLQISGGR